ncbi:hypothetical protein ACQKP5_27920 [Pseudomonas vancouverensis]|uniref:hypothetical protein n=1 Tax=Pseudomonas vancouverensis TaxID=95300 RepID=UPI003D0518F4
MTLRQRRITNPMTIIAIFATLSETSAAVSLPFLDDEERNLYIWFLISFPFYLLLLFFATLNFNYRSLYAPSDFRQEEHFMNIMEESKRAPAKAQAPPLEIASNTLCIAAHIAQLPLAARDLHIFDACATSEKTDIAGLLGKIGKAQEKAVHVVVFVTSAESDALLKADVLKHLKRTRKRHAMFCLAYNLNSHRLSVLEHVE